MAAGFPCESTNPDSLSLWTITRSPLDFPGKHVARRHIIMPDDEAGPTTDHLVGDTLDQVRALLPAGLVNIGRSPRDAPVIVETWI